MQEKIILKSPKGTEFWLLPQKCIYLPEEATWVIADLHFGKIQHFRKHGIPIPAEAAKNDYQNLIALTQLHPTRRIIFLGDIFHSHYNQEWQKIIALFQDFHQQNIALLLTTGNHDILHVKHYEVAHLSCCQQFQINDIIFLHEPPTHDETGVSIQYELEPIYMVGHIHPGIIVKGKAKQSMKFPCFAAVDQVIYLPAFGETTGLHCPKWPANAQIWAIVNESIIQINR